MIENIGSESAFEKVKLHKRLALIGCEIKGFKILDIAEIKNGIVKFNCKCSFCGTPRQIFHTALTSTKLKSIRCWGPCNPKTESFSTTTSRFYTFYRLYSNVHNRYKSTDFPDFHCFMNWAIDILGGAFRYDLNMRLVKRDSKLPHGFENTILVVKWENDVEERFFTKDTQKIS